MTQKHALITGITGQDGSYLSELLLSKGYKVYGLIRRSSSSNHTWRIDHLRSNPEFELVEGDLLDESSLVNAVRISAPDECFHLGAMSFVGTSWTQPILTAEITGLGTLRMLEAIRQVKPNCKFYFAGSSEQFGAVKQTPQNENTPFNPRSPYGVAKVYGYWITKNYRESYNMFCCSGILNNHESNRRGLEFVTRKITQGAAKIKLGLANELRLGNLDARRDWSHAKDMVRGMYMMMRCEAPDDYVLASGKSHSVREFCDQAFKFFSLDYKNYVVVDPKFYRPAEVDILLGDPYKAYHKLGWYPEITFKQMIYDMCKNDYDLLSATK